VRAERESSRRQEIELDDEAGKSLGVRRRNASHVADGTTVGSGMGGANVVKKRSLQKPQNFLREVVENAATPSLGIRRHADRPPEENS
jgi:hypothetical protein